MSQIEVNADEVMRQINYLDWLNSQNLEDIFWVDDKSATMDICADKYKDWKYIGMNNQSFVELMIFGEKDEVELKNYS